MLLKGIIPVLIVFSIFSSCRKDQAILKGPGTLNFTEDTVYFDTVFTKLQGSPYPRSITKRFMVLNPYKETVNMNVRLMGGPNSTYRINVDGQAGSNFTEVEILPKDSAWVFVEATLEPNSLTQPALVRDSIQFETNGNIQYVQLAAYGWDAYYFHDTFFSANTNLVLTDKPYVIVNSAFVDSGVTLTIGPGIHFYSTPNSGFKLSSGRIIDISALNVFGTLKINGTKDNPVIFEGDRLDNNFADKPGQWRGIHFWRGSIDNEIKHAVIKNATFGILVDSLPENANPNLKVKNTIIKNMSGYGLIGQTARIEVENTSISNCGIYTILMFLGGDYDFRHCSLHSNTKDFHVLANNQLRNENKVVIRTYDFKYVFFNSIIWKDGKDNTDATAEDTDIAKFLSASSGYSSCLLRAKNLVRSDIGCIMNKDPKFVNPGKNNLKLMTATPASPAKDAGRSDLGITIDLEEKSRADGKPDMGAYEL
jgi:hypothetical protein